MSDENGGSYGEESYGVKIETLQKAESYGEESYQRVVSGYDPGGSNGAQVSELFVDKYQLHHAETICIPAF